MQDAEEHDQLLILKLRLSTGTPTEFRAALIEDFGSVEVYSDMRDDRLLVGPFGITGMIEKLFDPLLDELPLDHPWYHILFDMFSTFAALLARRITNFKKVCHLSGASLLPQLTLHSLQSHSKKPQASSTQKTTAGGTASAEGGNARKTRSRSKGETM